MPIKIRIMFNRLTSLCIRKRENALGILTFLYAVIYSRALNYPWLGMDDKSFIVDNLYLRLPFWKRVIWALTDVTFGRRYVPFSWLAAAVPGNSTVLIWHLWVLILGLFLVWSVYLL